jgi:hypothetical protein
MRKRSVAGLSILAGIVMLAGLLAPAVPQAVYAQGGCGDAPPPRLSPGGEGRVTFTDGTPLRVRSAPGLAGTQVGLLPEGTGFQVLSGPVCADGFYWWQVQAGTLNGWVAEGTSAEYFAEPASSTPPPVPTPPIGTVQPLSTGKPFTVWNWTQFLQGYYQPDLPDPMTIAPPPTYQGHMPALPVDLGAVKFVQDPGLSQAQLALLAQNGFVVVPAGLDQFDEAYTEDNNWSTVPPTFDFNADPATQDIGHAYFITTDATLHALHYIFDNLLTDLEKAAFQPIITNQVIIPALQAAHQQTQQAAGTALATPATSAELYLAVGLELFSPGQVAQYTSPEIASQAQSIAALALAGEGQQDLSFLAGYTEDFSQYRPRGHYAGDTLLEQYFRGMMWISRITFVANDDAATQIALLLLRALRSAPAATDGWSNIHDTLTFLIGPTDDLGPPEYSSLADTIYGSDLPLDRLADPALLANFKAQVALLPGPRINGLILPNDTQASEVAQKTRGFRFLGQRFTFDGYVMQQLMYPYVGTRENPRLLPLGLDVPSVFGPSDLAYGLASDAGATGFAQYDTQTGALRAQISALVPDNWLENTYGGWLWSLKPLWQRDPVAYPPLMNTDAWLRKDLQTGLSSWTELKHDTVLYAKQPTGFGGGGPPLTSFGYVEPNPLVFARIAVVAAMTYQGLNERVLGMDFSAGYDVPRAPGYLAPYLRQMDDSQSLDASMGELRTLAFNATQYADIARKELAGEALTEDDYWAILSFGTYMNILLRTLYQGAGEPDPVALVTDVASNPSNQSVLQEAVGGVDQIYVVVPDPRGGLQLVKGGVFSYYEWVGNINQRMTDQEWRTKVKSGDLPQRPAWVGAFIGQ